LLREHRVEIVFRGGVFTLNADFEHPTLPQAARTRNWISMDTAAFPITHDGSEPPRCFPQLRDEDWPRGAILVVVENDMKIWLAAPLFMFRIGDPLTELWLSPLARR